MTSRSSPPASRSPTDVAPARFEASVHDVRIPENRVVELDAKSLETQAGTGQSLTDARSKFGCAEVLCKIGQTVILFGESITLGASQPRVIGTRMTDSAQAINSINYRQVGLSVNLAANPPLPDAPRKVPDTQVGFHPAALAESEVELTPSANASSTRTVDPGHGETSRFGKPCVLLDITAATGRAATLPTAFGVRGVFSQVKPRSGGMANR